MFSIELGSKQGVRSVSFDDDEKFVIEGSLGTLRRVHFLEDLVLEVIGSSGVLRLDLSLGDLTRSKGSEGEKEGGGGQ
jgi:hypothetical protein